MAPGDSRFLTWQVLLTISIVLAPVSAHGRHSLARRYHHHNQSSFSKEALNTRMVLSDDSAERDHLIGAGLSLGAKLPLSSKHLHSHKRSHLDIVEEDAPAGEELTAGGAGPDQPGNPLTDDVITVAFHSPAPDIVPSDVALDWTKVAKPQKQKSGNPPAWGLSDFYDYSPDDDLSAVDVTPEPEPSPSPPADMEDENPLLAGSPAAPTSTKSDMTGISTPRATPMPGREKSDGLDVGGAMGADGCRLGFVLSGPGVCVSQCEIEPNFCFNGGVCTVIAGSGAFCRCNVQDYIWNKGTRCDWAVTEFQVMCVVVGVASLVLILLFMIIVFFAKRLHHLKNENRRLRRHSKYRPQSSEPQTDGLSVSTTADGSQPNVRKLCDTPPPAPQAHTHNLAYYDNIICQRPSAASYTWEYKPRNSYNHFQDEPQKQIQDQAKSPQAKEEGSMNILNSHSPKHENNRPSSVIHDQGRAPNNAEEYTEDGVTIGLEVLLPKEAKRHADTSPPLQYDVFLYKVANSGESASPSNPTNAYSSSHPTPRSPKTPKMPKSPKHSREPPPGDREPLSGRQSSPGRHPLPGRHPSPTRHSAPGCYPSHHSSSHFQRMPTSSSSPPQHRRSRGASQASVSECPPTGGGHQSGHLHPSPSSPHLTQPPPSPSRVKCSPVSTRSLPPLS